MSSLIQAAEMHAPGLVLDCMCGRLAVPNPGLDYEPYPFSSGQLDVKDSVQL